MSTTDLQEVRISLGARLRELRSAARLTGQQLADRLGWTQSKVSKLETGRQTATAADLRAWAQGTGHPGAAGELLDRLQQLSTPSPQRRRRSTGAGQRPAALRAAYQQSAVVHGWSGTVVADVLQTAEYARQLWTRRAHLLAGAPGGKGTSNGHGHADGGGIDVAEAVRATLRVQEALYVPGRSFHILLWEAALHARVCPAPVLAAQLDRLCGVIGLDTVTLGIVPLDAPLRISPVPGFWVYDDRLVVSGEWPEQQWLETPPQIARHREIWQALAASAVHGPEAAEILTRARRRLD